MANIFPKDFWENFFTYANWTIFIRIFFYIYGNVFLKLFQEDLFTYANTFPEDCLERFTFHMLGTFVKISLHVPTYMNNICAQIFVKRIYIFGCCGKKSEKRLVG